MTAFTKVVIARNLHAVRERYPMMRTLEFRREVLVVTEASWGRCIRGARVDPDAEIELIAPVYGAWVDGAMLEIRIAQRKVVRRD